VANESSPDGVRIAESYMARRAVPADQLVRLATATTDEIDRALFERTIQRPIAEWLARHAAQDRILYILLTRGMPLRIRGTAGRQGTMASVDSELALLYRRLTGVTVPVNGPVANPYFAGESDTELARPFTRADHDIYLVTRLDGFSSDDALALVERGAAPAKRRRRRAGRAVRHEGSAQPLALDRRRAPGGRGPRGRARRHLARPPGPRAGHGLFLLGLRRRGAAPARARRDVRAGRAGRHVRQHRRADVRRAAGRVGPRPGDPAGQHTPAAGSRSSAI
jgi:hypothetical protein